MKVSGRIEILMGMLLLGLTIILFFYADDPGQKGVEVHQILSEENGLQKITYTNNNGELVCAPDESYAIVIREKDPDGRIASELYYDDKEEPSFNKFGAYGIHNEYDDRGFNITTTYVDQHEDPMNIALGFATIRRLFNENGTMRNALYYDAEGIPTKSVFDQYGYYREYDNQKRIILNTFLDENGKPMVGTTGYASVVTTYDENTGKVSTERYLDQNGNPIALVRGQYGVKYVGDKTVFLDINGKEYFNLYCMFENYPYCALVVAFLVSVMALFTGKRFNIFLLILSLVFICYMTLMNRNVADLRTNFNLFSPIVNHSKSNF